MPYLGLQKNLLPTVQVSLLTSGVISLTSTLATATASATYLYGGSPESRQFQGQMLKFNHHTNVLTWTGHANNRGTSGCGFSNNGVKGYAIIGLKTDNTDNVANSTREVLDYATDVTTYQSNQLSQNKVNPSTVVNGSTAGYICGGNVAGSASDNVNKMPFSTETNSSLGAILSPERNGPAGFSSTTVGYVHGGNMVAGGGAMNTTFDKITFSTDTRATSSSVLSGSQAQPASMTNPSVAGYAAGGEGAGYVSNIRKVLFSTDTASVIGVSLSSARGGAEGGQSNTLGYIFGGYGGSFTDEIETLNFSSETMGALSAKLFHAMSNPSTFSNHGT